MYEIDPAQEELSKTAFNVYLALQSLLGPNAPTVFVPKVYNGNFDLTFTREQGELLVKRLEGMS